MNQWWLITDVLAGDASALRLASSCPWGWKEIGCFEGNKAETATMIPIVKAAHPKRGCSWGLKPPASSRDLAMV